MEPIAGLSAAQVARVILARPGQVLWWEKAGALRPHYPRETTVHRWLFHDLVEAMVLRSLLAPLHSTEPIPKLFQPLDEHIHDQMMEVRQVLFAYKGPIRDITLCLGIEGEVMLTNGRVIQNGAGFHEISVKQLESLAFSELLSQVSVEKWAVLMSHSEAIRAQGIALPEHPLTTVTA